MRNNSKIAIIGAMDCEIIKLKELMNDIKILNYGKFEIYLGKIFNHDVILAKSGVGKVCAAITTQYIIDNYSPDFIINTGVAGGIANGLSVGDIVIGTKFIQHDFNATALGYVKGYMCTGGDNQKPTEFFADKKLISEFENAVSKIHTDTKLHKGIIVTGDCFVGDVEQKKELKLMFNASAAEMEAAAIAQTANYNEIPCLIVRAISDLADGSACDSIAQFETKMAQFSSLTISALLQNI